MPRVSPPIVHPRGSRELSPQRLPATGHRRNERGQGRLLGLLLTTLLLPIGPGAPLRPLLVGVVILLGTALLPGLLTRPALRRRHTCGGDTASAARARRGAAVPPTRWPAVPCRTRLGAAGVLVLLGSIGVQTPMPGHGVGAVGPVAAAAPCAGWALAAEFRTGVGRENPNPDGCGNPAVWSFLGGASSAHDPATYSVMGSYRTVDSGISDVESWYGGSPRPSVGKNVTGADQNVGGATWPAGALQAHPGDGRLVVVAWRSPIAGTVAIGGAIARQDPTCGNGVAWSIDRGGTSIASGDPGGGTQRFATGANGGQLSAVAVAQNETLYFVVDPKGDYQCDTMGPDVRIAPAAASAYDQGHDGAGCIGYSAFVADPVNVAEDDVVEQQQDFGVPGLGQSLALVRSYNSGVPDDVGFGVGWTFPYGVAVLPESPTSAVVRNADCRAARYTDAGGAAWTPPPGVDNRLVKNGDGGWTLTTPDQTVYALDATGRLVGQHDRYGNAVALAVRALWYVCIGWWLTGVAISVGYVLALTVIGLPVALMIFNRLGSVLTLRPYAQKMLVTTTGHVTLVRLGNAQQRSFLARTLYFLFIGWWWGAIWLGVAYTLALLIVTLPAGIMMMNRTGAAMTLYRY